MVVRVIWYLQSLFIQLLVFGVCLYSHIPIVVSCSPSVPFMFGNMTSQVERLTGNSQRSLYHPMFTYLSDEDVDRAVVSIAFKTFIHIMPHTIEQKLPEELLNNIVSFTSRDTFSSLSRTTKTFNRLATPHFYSDVFFRSDDHLLELTYLMLTSPIHARLVKTFTMPNTWASSGEHTIGWSRSRHEGIESVLRTKCAEWTSSDAEAVRIF